MINLEWQKKYLTYVETGEADGVFLEVETHHETDGSTVWQWSAENVGGHIIEFERGFITDGDAMLSAERWLKVYLAGETHDA